MNCRPLFPYDSPMGGFRPEYSPQCQLSESNNFGQNRHCNPAPRYNPAATRYSPYNPHHSYTPYHSLNKPTAMRYSPYNPHLSYTPYYSLNQPSACHSTPARNRFCSPTEMSTPNTSFASSTESSTNSFKSPSYPEADLKKNSNSYKSPSSLHMTDGISNTISFKTPSYPENSSKWSSEYFKPPSSGRMTSRLTRFDRRPVFKSNMSSRSSYNKSYVHPSMLEDPWVQLWEKMKQTSEI